MVGYCRRHSIAVSMRGRAHTTHGQGLSDGLVIDSSALNRIHSIRRNVADVDTGASWKDLVFAAYEQKLMPPALTGYVGLTVGGTLSVGGELGDRRWRELLDRHDEEVRAELDRFRGQLIRSTGDGVLAMFDGAARAVRCAGAIRTTLLRHGLEIRAGLHTGEVELRESGPDGIAVHIAARVGELAESGEVLVSQTVKDLTVGADLAFEPRGTHPLKGVPGDWQTYATIRF